MTKDIFNHQYECPVCFLHWQEMRADWQEGGRALRKCHVCAAKEPTLEELIDRQLDVLHCASVNKFPVVVSNIWKYIKENKNAPKITSSAKIHAFPTPRDG